MKELNTQLYIMYIAGEGEGWEFVLCVFDKLPCPLRAKMLKGFIKTC